MISPPAPALQTDVPMMLFAFTHLMQDGAASTEPTTSNLMVLVGGIWLVIWFMLIRPQGKERKRLQAMREAVKKNDRVVTSSGIFATVAAIGDNDITLRIADGVRVRFARSAIAEVLADEGSQAD